MNPTSKQISAMIMQHQKNDFAPVRYSVIDRRETHSVTIVEPLRSASEIPYYEERGYTCVVRENRGEFWPQIKQVVELTREESKVLTFTTWNDAAVFVGRNYAELAAARSAHFAAQWKAA